MANLKLSDSDLEMLLEVQCIDYFGYPDLSSKKKEMDSMHATKSMSFIKSRSKKIWSKLEKKIAVSDPSSSDFLDKVTTQELKCVARVQNLETRTKCLKWLSYIGITVGFSMFYIYINYRVHFLQRFMNKATFLRPINFALIGLPYTIFCSYSYFTEQQQRVFYQILKPLDDPKEAQEEIKHIMMMKKEKEASKEALNKYKFDPQSYH
ncbi:unnamed protein product [Moneuplotes crassus]|uniref:Transmembrane protein n=1 Tax=Euplotes crassus TaxID=5936 RepID=A0AAD2D4Q6_EUPCR|nr:unnamed protein product [Moneuplotes crassus]